MDAQFRESGRDGFRDLALPGPAITEDGLADGPGRVGGELEPGVLGQASQASTQGGKAGQGIERSLRDVLEHEREWPVGADPGRERILNRLEPATRRDGAERQDSRHHELLPREDGVADITE